MRFICKSLKDNDQWDGADCLVMSISREYARELIDTQAACVTFLRSRNERYMGKVVLGWCSDMCAFDYCLMEDKEDLVAAYETATSHGGFEVIPEEFDPDTLYENDEAKSFYVTRLRGQQIMFYADGAMRLTAYEKHTGYTLESEEFNTEFLQGIING